MTDDDGTTGTTYIDFGTPNTSVMSDVADIVWIDSINRGGWWTNYVTGWRWTGSETEYALTKLWGLTDTGSSCISGPSATIDAIRAEAESRIQGWHINDSGWGKLFGCGERSNMPSFDILFGDYWMTVLASDYIVPVNDYGTCGICLTGGDDGYWLLGDAFMRSWYNIHDHANGRMGFVPFAGSPKSKAQLATETPTQPAPGDTVVVPNSSALNAYDIVTISSACVIFLGSCIAWICIKTMALS